MNIIFTFFEMGVTENSKKDKIIIIIIHGEKISDYYTDLNDRSKARAECLPI